MGCGAEMAAGSTDTLPVSCSHESCSAATYVALCSASCLLPAQHMQQYGMYVKPYCWASSTAWLPCRTAAREVQGSKQHERLAAAGPLRRLQALHGVMGRRRRWPLTDTLPSQSLAYAVLHRMLPSADKWPLPHNKLCADAFLPSSAPG